MIKLEYKINFKSDYHVSTGKGFGCLVDSVLFRDQDNLPVIRGTSICGIFRQSMYDLLQSVALTHYRKCKQSGGDVNNSYCEDNGCPICTVFGSPYNMKPWRFSSARLDKENVRVNSEFKTLNAEAVYYRNKIDRKLGKAQDKMLFTTELGSKEWEFTFDVSSYIGSKQTILDTAFLIAASKMINSIGSNKTRGLGECSIKVKLIKGILYNGEPVNENMMLDLFEKYYLENKKDYIENFTIHKEKESECLDDNELVDDNELEFYDLIFRLDEPLIISKESESGNIFDSIDYIPGSTVLGALANIASQQITSDNYNEFLHLFCEGGIRFSCLYPTNYENNKITPTLPTPLDFYSCKADKTIKFRNKYPKHSTYRFCIDSLTRECKECKNGLTHPGGYIILDRNLEWKQLQRVEDAHVTIDPQKETAEDGKLFSMKALAPGQYFIGEIIAKKKDIHKLRKFINFDFNCFNLYLGRFKSKGYGKVTCSMKKRIGERLWLNKPIEKRINNNTNTYTMYFINHTILKDDWGRYLFKIDEKALADLLGLEVEKIKIERAFFKTEVIDGFNYKAGMPKNRDLAIKAGSGFTFKIARDDTVNIDEVIKKMNKIEQNGIGERRHEGFGNVVFNHDIYDNQENNLSNKIDVSHDMRLTQSNYNFNNGDSYLSYDELKKMKEKIEANSNTKLGNYYLVLGRYLASISNEKLFSIKEKIDSWTDSCFKVRKKESEYQLLKENVNVIKDCLETIQMKSKPDDISAKKDIEEISKVLIQYAKEEGEQK